MPKSTRAVAALLLLALLTTPASAVLTELPQLFTVSILGWCSFDRLLVDLSTNRVAE